MVTYQDFNITMPCYNCLITGLDTDLTWADGSTANANKGIWLHHTGLMNLNRTDAACPKWPERIGVNGNERSSFDFTNKGYVVYLLVPLYQPLTPFLVKTGPAKQATTSPQQITSSKQSTS